MGAGFRATFVLSWAQTEVDGLTDAPLGALVVGTGWRWSGQAVRIDGPQDVLVLAGAEGADDLRRRAARTVRRLVGAALRSASARPEAQSDGGDQCFAVSDGHRSYDLTLIAVPGTGSRLLMCVGDLPPVATDLWVVRGMAGGLAAAPEEPVEGGLICFTPGTMIRTPAGARRIETLRPGDRIQTRDDGMQPVLWTGSRRMTGARLHAMPHLRPVRFRTGALGIGRPDRELLVSPHHRMLVKGAVARALFNAPEVLVAADSLLDGVAVAVDHALREVTYVHVLLDRHQIVWANGLETESFHPGHAALDTLAPGDRVGLMAALPGLAAGYGAPARRTLTATEAAILRHDIAA